MKPINLHLIYLAAILLLVFSCKSEQIEEPVPVTGIEISPSSKTLEVGKHDTLELIITPSKSTFTDYIWLSSEPSIARVMLLPLMGKGVSGLPPRAEFQSLTVPAG